MSEKSKEEISEEINKLLGTQINFTKLSREELTSLYEAILKLKEEATSLLDKPIGQILNAHILPGRPLKDLTLRELLGLPKERKGILGLGIVPRLRNMLEERRQPKES